MQRITKYKNYILGVIGVLLTLTMFVGFKYLMKPKYGELPEVKLREINNKKSFAIMKNIKVKIIHGLKMDMYLKKQNVQTIMVI